MDEDNEIFMRRFNDSFRSGEDLGDVFISWDADTDYVALLCDVCWTCCGCRSVLYCFLNSFRVDVIHCDVTTVPDEVFSHCRSHVPEADISIPSHSCRLCGVKVMGSVDHPLTLPE